MSDNYYRDMVSINDLFLANGKSTLGDYNDGNTLYTSGKDSSTVISKLKHKISKISDNFMVLNPDKYHSLTAGFQDAQVNFFYDNITIKNVSEEKILLIVNDLFVVSYN